MTREEAIKQINELNAIYNAGGMGRAVYLKKHKAISDKYKRAHSLSGKMKADGIKILKKTSGWYTFVGKNFKVDFWKEACETSWWEVCIHDDGVDKRVLEFFEDYNKYDTKQEVVNVLYGLDKRLTDEA